MKKGILYISYDGMLEPLGQSQVLAYQERLASEFELHLLSFEKPSDWKNVEARARISKRLSDAGIYWHPRRYHKRPSALATAYDILVGIVSGAFLVVRYRLRVLHARSYVPSVMALALKRLTGAKFIFDMRGFWADERVDGGLWPKEGRLYRVAKWFERRFLLSADHVVSLTRAAAREMAQFPYLVHGMPPVSIIPTCADLARFKPANTPPADFVVGYVGSAGTWYLFDQVVSCFSRLLLVRPGARLLVINRNEHAYIRGCLSAGGVPEELVEIRSAEYSEVPTQMARMSVAIFFVKPAFSKQASAPTKLGEFLGCGIPCLTNNGVGDTAELLREDKVGIAIDRFDNESLDHGVQALLELSDDVQARTRCVNTARMHFSLDEGVGRYRAVYEELLS